MEGMDTGMDNAKGVPLDEAATILGITPDALRKRLQRGNAEGFKKTMQFGEQWFISAAEIERLKPSAVSTLNETAPPEVSTPEETETAKVIDLAVAVFDYFSDPERFELDYRNQPVFSVELCRRHLEVDKTTLEESLRVLEQQAVIQAHIREANPRAREMRPINPEWLKPGSREHLLRVLRPEPPKLVEPFGPARVLARTDVYVGKQLVSFRAGQIVRDEHQVQALLSAGRAVAKLEETTTRMCADPKCRHRYDVSESPTLDYPVLEALERIHFTNGTSVWLNRGDIVSDRSRCLYMTGVMKERLQHSVRALEPAEYEVCPRCRRVSRSEPKISAAAS